MMNLVAPRDIAAERFLDLLSELVDRTEVISRLILYLEDSNVRLHAFAKLQPPRGAARPGDFDTYFEHGTVTM